MKSQNKYQSHQHQVLLVDDDINVLKALQRSLRKFNFTFLLATSGQEALEIMRSHKPDGFSLIISDQYMPVMNGLEFLNQARKIMSDAIRILITGQNNIHIAIDSINTGNVDYFLTKPWNDTDLQNIIKRMIERYELILKNNHLDELVKQQNLSLKRLNEDLERQVRFRTAEIEKQKNHLKRLNQELIEKNNSMQGLFISLEDNFIHTIQIFIKLLEMRDTFIAAHCKQVAVHSMEIAKQLNFSEQDILDVEISGLLHDIGKMGMTNDVLIKSYHELTDHEKNLYHSHPALGEELIVDVERLKPISKIIRHHHENFDGSGYPDGLKGEDIPIGSRIVHICNFCDNVLHKRHWFRSDYNTSLKNYLNTMSGKLFDSEITRIYIAMMTPDELERKI